MEVSTSIHLDASADHVWEIIGPGFANVSDWASAIPESSGTGEAGPNGAPCAGRVCRVAAAGFDQISEQITAYDPLVRRVAYRAVHGMPGFVTEALNAWRATPGPDGGTEFTMQAQVRVVGIGRLVGPLLRLYLTWMGHRISRDLKTYAETGVVSRAKTIQTYTSQRAGPDRAVVFNAAFSTVCGAALAVKSTWWSHQVAEPGSAVIAAVGVGLVAYGAVLAYCAGRGVTRETGRFLAAMDAGWVLGTLGVLAVFWAEFTRTGLAATVFAGLAVASVGMLQWRRVEFVDHRAEEAQAQLPGAATDDQDPTVQRARTV